jgi:hypothetical protein
MTSGNKLLPDDPIWTGIRDFWDRFIETGDSGEAPWEALERLRLRVCDCAGRDPPDRDQAASLTAQALLMMQGGLF